MAPRNRIELEEQRDFTGGMNVADDIMNLAPNESFDLQNVDVDRRGGFSIRRGTKKWITTATGLPISGTPDSGYTYVDTGATRHVLVARGGHVKRWDGAAWQDVDVVASSGRTMFVEMNNALYLGLPGSVPKKWTGAGLATALTTVVGNYNDDLTAPNFGNMPACWTLAQHHQVMWAGGVVDAAATERCRLRWSHPGQPEDWRTNDYIDVDKDDENGNITALVPFGDRLLVFKDKAVYAVHGYPPAGFSVQNLTKEVGTPSQWSVVATESSVYFWDVDTGVWEYDGKSFRHVFQKLYPLMDDNKVNMAFSFQTIVEFHNERLWVAAPFIAAPYANQILTMVFDPSASKEGAWTVHTTSPFGWWRHRGSTGGDVHLLGGNTNAPGYLYEFDVENYYYDQTAADVQNKIVAWYTTRWFDAGSRAHRKRWKRPVFVVQGGVTQTTVVDVLTDYDPTRVVKTFQLVSELDPAEGIWDTDDWDDFFWAAETLLASDKAVILRGSPLGTGVAKALRMKNTTGGQDWRVHGLTMKWITKRLRN